MGVLNFQVGLTSANYYKRKYLFTNFKNYHYHLKLYEKIKKEKKQQKEFLNLFNLKPKPERTIKHRKLKMDQ